MNIRCIVFSSVITCMIGSILGVAVAEINQSDRYHSRAHTLYAWLGSGFGLVVGAAQEAIRQQAHRNNDNKIG